MNFNAGSTYEVDVTPQGAHDLITATGAVTLSSGAGVAVRAVSGIYRAATTYAIITTTDQVTGTFGSITSDYAFLTPSLGYDAQHVYLTLNYNGLNFTDFAQTPNQFAVAAAAEVLPIGNTLWESLVTLPAGAVAPAFNQLSGEAYASVNTVIQQEAVFLRDAVGARLRQSLTPPGAQALGYAAAAAGPATAQLSEGLTPTLWMQGYGAWGNAYGNGNAASISSSIGGFLAGLDVAVGGSSRVGVVAGYSQSQFDVDARNANGTIGNYDLGLYAGTQLGPWALRGGVSYTWHDVSLDRSIVFPGFSGSTSGGYTQGTTQVFGEAAYGFAVGATAFEPFLGLAYVNLSSASTQEAYTTVAALSVDVQGQSTFYTTLGLRAATSLSVMGRAVHAVADGGLAARLRGHDVHRQHDVRGNDDAVPGGRRSDRGRHGDRGGGAGLCAVEPGDDPGELCRPVRLAGEPERRHRAVLAEVLTGSAVRCRPAAAPAIRRVEHALRRAGRLFGGGTAREGLSRVSDRDHGTGMAIAHGERRMEVAGEGLDDPGAQARLGGIHSGRKADAVIGHRKCPALARRTIVDGDPALRLIGKGMLQCIDDKLRHDQPQADGAVRLHDRVIHRHGDRKPPCIGNHRGAKAFAQLCEIAAKLHLSRLRSRELLLNRGDRHDPGMGVLEVPAHFLRLNPSGALHEHAGNDLQAVRDPVLNLLQQDGLLPHEVVPLARLGAGIGHIADGHEQAGSARIAILKPPHIDDQTPGALARAHKVDLIGVDAGAARRNHPEERCQRGHTPFPLPQCAQPSAGNGGWIDLEGSAKGCAGRDQGLVRIQEQERLVGRDHDSNRARGLEMGGRFGCHSLGFHEPKTRRACHHSAATALIRHSLG